jgi:hypothetical protein
VTYLSLDSLAIAGVSDSTHLVVYRQRMHWWGTDPDGTVIGYEWRIVSLTESGARFDSTAWSFTTRTDSTFDFPAPDPLVRRVFEVRAVDNLGVRDPVGRSQELLLRNSAPHVTINRALFPATSLPALTVFWAGRDPEGGTSLKSYRIWLDGMNEADGLTVLAPDSSVTLAPSFFAGRYGVRTVYVRALDTGGLTSVPDSMRWTVAEPHGSVLLFDDYPDDQSGNGIIDNFYASTLMTAVGADGYTLYSPSTYGSIRSSNEADALLGIFNQVVWYRDEYTGAFRPHYSDNMRIAERGLLNLLARGGGIFLSGPSTVGTDSSVSSGSLALKDTILVAGGFARDVFGITSFRAKALPNSVFITNFSVSGFDANGLRQHIDGNPAVGTDSLGIGVNLGVGNPSFIPNVDCLIPDSAAVASGAVQVLWQVPPHQLDDQDITKQQPDPCPVALFSTLSGGKAALITMPMSLLNYYGNAAAQLRLVLGLIGAPVLP